MLKVTPGASHSRIRRRALALALAAWTHAWGVWGTAAPADASDLQLATFQTDVTPPLGSPLCDALCPPAVQISDPLSARGIVLQWDNQPAIVIVAVDWVGIGNAGHHAWRRAIAEACEIDVNRVCVHCLHQHDAPGCDFAAEEIGSQVGMAGRIFPVEFARQSIDRVAESAGAARARLQKVTHVGWGKARVVDIASNRRVMGDDGQVASFRMTACKDPAVRAAPAGVIDPFARVVAFYQNDRPLAALSYYATHPQSYYGAGEVSADFVGHARDIAAEHEKVDLHLHFNGAGGNIGAGKYNDGAKENRPALASRLADGLIAAWEQLERADVSDLTCDWKSTDFVLPVAPWYDEASMTAQMSDERLPDKVRGQAVRSIAWARRCAAGEPITAARLRVGPVEILHMPGELFVEYQLAAQQMKPEAFVCMAAYGDYGMGYIGTAAAYSQGGYETGVASKASRVSARSEVALMQAIDALLAPAP
ncbi:MAG: hypothetical protein KDA61_16890 [Planctomycetales bacterium]|nr:hypothetical protein [Planctomycetales bacterium]